MLDHVDIRVADRAASLRFYAAVLAALGRTERLDQGDHTDWGDFSIVGDGKPVARHVALTFRAPSAATAEAALRAGAEAGGTAGDGALRDPDGNRVAVVAGDGRPGALAHLGLRTPDVAAVRAFHRTAGLVPIEDEPDRVRVGPDVTYVAGEPPSAHVHLAFRVAADAEVDAFHAALIAAGHPDNGTPGERPHYHPGYYGAFVLDPDGHNVEAVVHHRR